MDKAPVSPWLVAIYHMMLLFRLGGLLDSAEKVKEVVGLDQAPVVREGMNERGLVEFCLADQDAKKKLEGWVDPAVRTAAAIRLCAVRRRMPVATAHIAASPSDSTIYGIIHHVKMAVPNSICSQYTLTLLE